MDKIEFEQIKQTLSQHGYEYHNLLGKGSFSVVLLCQSKKYNQQFAVKRSINHRLTKLEYVSLVSVSHPNIIKLYDAFDDESAHYLAMEYCQNGTIRQRLPLSYDKFIYYAKQLLEALAYCHKNNIAHRDIKPDNILLDQYNQAKLADFGLAKQFNTYKKSNEKVGSLIFLAPEILHYYEVDPFKADIWALGITFFVMVTGKYPYKGKSKDELKSAILYGEIDYSSYTIDPRIQFLISKMTNKSVRSRPTAEKLLQLPLFASTLSRKTSLVVDTKFRRTYTTGFSNQQSTSSNKLISFDCNKICFSDDDDVKKQTQPLDILSYRNINVNPKIQRISTRSQTTKPV